MRPSLGQRPRRCVGDRVGVQLHGRRVRPNIDRGTQRMRTADDDEANEARENTDSTGAEHVIRVFDDPAEIDAASWDALVAAQPSATPFVSMAYLRALHESASAVADTGWAPHFLVLEPVSYTHLRAHETPE